MTFPIPPVLIEPHYNQSGKRKSVAQRFTSNISSCVNFIFEERWKLQVFWKMISCTFSFMSFNGCYSESNDLYIFSIQIALISNASAEQRLKLAGVRIAMCANSVKNRATSSDVNNLTRSLWENATDGRKRASATQKTLNTQSWRWRSAVLALVK